MLGSPDESIGEASERVPVAVRVDAVVEVLEGLHEVAAHGTDLLAGDITNLN